MKAIVPQRKLISQVGKLWKVRSFTILLLDSAITIFYIIAVSQVEQGQAKASPITRPTETALDHLSDSQFNALSKTFNGKLDLGEISNGLEPLHETLRDARIPNFIIPIAEKRLTAMYKEKVRSSSPPEPAVSAPAEENGHRRVRKMGIIFCRRG